MAVKKVPGVKEASDEAPKVFVDLATSEEDVIGYDQAGAILIFNKKRFRRLSKENLDVLSYENKKEYMKTVKLLQDEEEARKPSPKAQIIDPLGGHEGALLEVRITDKEFEKKWHLCWKHAREADSLARVGYQKVVAGEDPVESGLKPAGTTFVIKDPRSREDLDLLLMKLPKHLFLQHQTAVAQASTEKIKGYRDKFLGDVTEESKGRLKGIIEDEPTEKMNLSSKDLRDA
jgi:hypothetical protein